MPRLGGVSKVVVDMKIMLTILIIGPGLVQRFQWLKTFWSFEVLIHGRWSSYCALPTRKKRREQLGDSSNMIVNPRRKVRLDKAKQGALHLPHKCEQHGAGEA